MNSAASVDAAQPVRAAIYLRISQDREMDGLAIERQRQDCEALARFRRWEVVETYVDQSKSATDKTKKRPAYDRMVADYEAGRFSAIVCYDLDRLTRQPRQLEDWIDRAETRGLALVTANGDADLSTDGGRLFARIKAAVARGEVERKSARQSRAHVQRASEGRVPKGVRPLGYSTDGNVVRKEAKAVRAIYDTFDRGASLRGIARALSGMQEEDDRKADQVKGVPKLPNHSRTLTIERNEKRAAEDLPAKPVPDDRPWAESTVLGILRNPRYAGYSVYTDVRDRRATVADNQSRLANGERPRGRRRDWREFVVKGEDGLPVKGKWTPLVSEDLWQRVQLKLDDDSRVTNRVGTHRRHLGSGLYVCGVCGSFMRGWSRGYRCKQACMSRTGGPIDELVRGVVAERLRQPDALRSVAATDSPRLTGLQAEIDEQRGRIARAEHDYDAGLLEAADLKRNRTRAKEAIARLEAEIRTLPRGIANLPILGSDDPAQAFLDADLNVQRATIEALVRVTLHPQTRGRKKFNPASVGIDFGGANENPVATT
ncbi:recombinase family protein [Tessaracoccus massiliensis]|uniref:recombinase family protein n=1 Tax=Tessaracoccus massiliensis TaxID=1522311 RepID=UPI00058FCC56|nr:recombinase family protein [Tessaracoccus massiliensis]